MLDGLWSVAWLWFFGGFAIALVSLVVIARLIWARDKDVETEELWEGPRTVVLLVSLSLLGYEVLPWIVRHWKPSDDEQQIRQARDDGLAVRDRILGNP